MITTSTNRFALSPEHQQLADALAEVHEGVRLGNGGSGLHAYIACPVCLQDAGKDELSDRHLAVNLDKAVKGRDRVCMCMRCDEIFNVSELLSMKPLEERGHERNPEIINKTVLTANLCEPDGNGNEVPKGPGQTIPSIALPEDHPAILYLRSRNFDPAALYQQFGAEYCVRERTNTKYTRLGHGFRLSPQGASYSTSSSAG
jgi:hypothetical protein